MRFALTTRPSPGFFQPFPGRLWKSFQGFLSKPFPGLQGPMGRVSLIGKTLSKSCQWVFFFFFFWQPRIVTTTTPQQKRRRVTFDLLKVLPTTQQRKRNVQLNYTSVIVPLSASTFIRTHAHIRDKASSTCQNCKQHNRHCDPGAAMVFLFNEQHRCWRASVKEFKRI